MSPKSGIKLQVAGYRMAPRAFTSVRNMLSTCFLLAMTRRFAFDRAAPRLALRIPAPQRISARERPKPLCRNASRSNDSKRHKPRDQRTGAGGKVYAARRYTRAARCTSLHGQAASTGALSAGTGTPALHPRPRSPARGSASGSPTAGSPIPAQPGAVRDVGADLATPLGNFHNSGNTLA